MIERLAGRFRSCLTMQGYGSLSDGERRSLWLGLRFSPALCLAGIALGVLRSLDPASSIPSSIPSTASTSRSAGSSAAWLGQSSK